MTDVSRPQPVLDLVGEAAALATRVSAFVKGIGAVLVLVGITTEDDVARWATVIGLVVVTGGELATYIYTRVQLARAAREAAAEVTPLAAPQDNRGVELVPVDQVQTEAATADAAAAMIERAGVDDPGRHTAPE